MPEKKLLNIDDVNKLEMHDFFMDDVDPYEETLLISGNRGYPQHYRLELKFSAVEYIACAPSFGDMGTFQFRHATEQETRTIYENYLEMPTTVVVYCFEEDLFRWKPVPQRIARKFFIAARSVEITVYSIIEI